MSRHELITARTSSPVKTGLRYGALISLLGTWSAYLATAWTIPLGGPEAFKAASFIWTMVTLPGMLLGEITGLELYEPYSSDLSVAGCLLISLPNALIGAAGGAMIGGIIQARDPLVPNTAPKLSSARERMARNLMAAAMGFILGTFVTLFVYFLAQTSAHHAEHTSIVGLFSAICLGLLGIPSNWLAATFGAHLDVWNMRPGAVAFMVLTNGLLFASLGFIAAVAFSSLKRAAQK